MWETYVFPYIAVIRGQSQRKHRAENQYYNTISVGSSKDAYLCISEREVTVEREERAEIPTSHKSTLPSVHRGQVENLDW